MAYVRAGCETPARLHGKGQGNISILGNYPLDLGLDSCRPNIILCNIFRAFQRNSGDLEEYCSGQNVIKCPLWCSFGGKHCSTVSHKMPFMLENELTCQPSCFPRRLLFFFHHALQICSSGQDSPVYFSFHDQFSPLLSQPSIFPRRQPHIYMFLYMIHQRFDSPEKNCTF